MQEGAPLLAAEPRFESRLTKAVHEGRELLDVGRLQARLERLFAPAPKHQYICFVEGEATLFVVVARRTLLPLFPHQREHLPSAPLDNNCCRSRRARSEEPTFELQSLMRNSYADFCLKKINA